MLSARNASEKEGSWFGYLGISDDAGAVGFVLPIECGRFLLLKKLPLNSRSTRNFRFADLDAAQAFVGKVDLFNWSHRSQLSRTFGAITFMTKARATTHVRSSGLVFMRKGAPPIEENQSRISRTVHMPYNPLK
jgi:hypothetical protein